MRLVVKLFALLVVAGLCLEPNHFKINAQSEKKKDGRTGKFFLLEIIGAGAALFDYNNDGDTDMYLVQGSVLETTDNVPWREAVSTVRTTSMLRD